MVHSQCSKTLRPPNVWWLPTNSDFHKELTTTKSTWKQFKCCSEFSELFHFCFVILDKLVMFLYSSASNCDFKKRWADACFSFVRIRRLPIAKVSHKYLTERRLHTCDNSDLDNSNYTVTFLDCGSHIWNKCSTLLSRRCGPRTNSPTSNRTGECIRVLRKCASEKHVIRLELYGLHCFVTQESVFQVSQPITLEQTEIPLHQINRTGLQSEVHKDRHEHV